MVEPTPQKKTAVLLMNLGTPDAPTAPAVRRYLREFLSDRRVIEIPKIVWQVILNLFVLTTRPQRVAHAYAGIWQEDSPIRAILRAQGRALQEKLADSHPNVTVRIATTYGNPNVRDVIDTCLAEGIDNFVILPLYPQYSATSTGAAFDAVMRHLMTKRNVPSVHFIKDYHDHPLYIRALTDSVRRHWHNHGQADKLLLSFHGIPKSYADKGDPYPERCHATARLVATALGLDDGAWAIGFQSRFGAQEWVKPYTDALLAQWGQDGVGSVQIMSPAFSADCLETLEELAVENREGFLKAGGQSYEYIAALNSDALHIEMMAALVRKFLC